MAEEAVVEEAEKETVVEEQPQGQMANAKPEEEVQI